jgi:hypothetical protein
MIRMNINNCSKSGAVGNKSGALVSKIAKIVSKLPKVVRLFPHFPKSGALGTMVPWNRCNHSEVNRVG